MHTLSPEDKRQIVQKARRNAMRILPKEAEGRLDGACLFLAIGFMQAYREWTGVVTLLQAGSASFKMVPDNQDDGVSPNYFSYQFSLAAALPYVARGELPEIHCWVGIKETRELVDVSTEFLPDQCKKLSGMDWRTPPPPPFVWDTTAALERQRDLIYTPDVDAIRIALRYANNVVTVARSGQ